MKFVFRHRELAAAARSSLPAVREEDDDAFTVEFGETELHRQAAIPSLCDYRKSSFSTFSYSRRESLQVAARQSSFHRIA